MKKLYYAFLSISIFFISYNSFSQPLSIQWQHSYGGSSVDYGQSIQQTTDGGYIVAGWSLSLNGNVIGNHSSSGDYWIIKLDSSGIIQWKKCLGGTGEDYAQSVEQTYDGGYVIAGSSNSIDGDVTGNHGNSDFWIVKIDSAGIIQWQESLGGSNQDVAYSIHQNRDSSYIVAGFSKSTNGNVTGNHGDKDYWVVKLSTSGSIIWQKSFGGGNLDEAYSVTQSYDDGFVVAGSSRSTNGNVTGFHGNDDYWVVKLDTAGNLQWQKSLGGTFGEVAQSIVQAYDGGFIVAGYTNSSNGDITVNHGVSDYWIVKLDSIGNIQWQKCYGGSSVDWAFAVKKTSDFGFIIAGYSTSINGDVTSNNGLTDYWVIKIDSIGSLQWQKSLGGSANDEAMSVCQTSDNGFIVAGVSESSDGDCTNNYGFFDYWIVKLTSDPTILNENIFSQNSLSIFPNPAISKCDVKCLSFPLATLSLFDMTGRILLEQNFNNKATIDVSALNEGMYIVKVFDKLGRSEAGIFAKH